MKQFDKSRAFARPSGTEDIIRVYAEAPSLEDAKKLAKIVCDLLSNNKELNGWLIFLL